MTNINNIKYFIGIDISKKTLDIAVLQNNDLIEHYAISNTKKALIILLKKLFKEGVSIDNSIFCAEFTGIYTNILIDFCNEKNLNLWLENAYHIKQSQGLKRGKNDKVDALRIAIYASRNKDDYKAFESPREVLKKIRILTSQRRQLIEVKKKLNLTIKEQSFRTKDENKLIESTIGNTIKALSKDLKEIEKNILTLIKTDEKLRNLYQIVTSVDGVGFITAIHFIIYSNEFKDISEAKKFACYAGVVPFKYSSGTSVNSKAKVSKMANHQMKKLLHMAALSSIQIKGDLKDFFERKVQQGKNKMSVINAIRNKIVLRVFACVKNNRIYQKNLNLDLVNP